MTPTMQGRFAWITGQGNPFPFLSKEYDEWLEGYVLAGLENEKPLWQWSDYII